MAWASVLTTLDIAILACMLNHLEYYQGREYILYVFTKTAVKTLGCIIIWDEI